MRLFLDEDIGSHLLAQFLRRAGHDVVRAADVGLRGVDDSVQFTYAIHEGRVLVSRNYDDYHNLHNLIVEAQGHHPGIFIVRRDDNPRRNMTPCDVVRAIRKLESAGQTVPDRYIILNHWQ